MCRYVVAAAAALAVLVAGPLATGGAEAFPASVPAGPAMAGGNGLVQDVAYVCRRVRTCGYYGCRWHRACYWTGPRHHRSWRHRYYRRHHW